MDAEEYMLLYEKYISGLCSEEEMKLLYEYQDNFEMLKQDGFNTDQLPLRTQIYDRIAKTIHQSKPKKLYQYTLFKAAAVLLVTSILTFFLLHDNQSSKEAQKVAVLHQQKNKIKPGSARATLTLSDGSVVDLAQAKNGLISANNQTTIHKAGTGVIAYSSKAKITAQSLLNTISVPQGGTYRVSLPDGTLVWLNSASSLTYPVQFTGKTRSVEFESAAQLTKSGILK
jgi:transmembrane sensor